MGALFPHGWAHYLEGGLVIGAGVALLFLATGLIGGISTFYTAVWSFVSRQPYFQQARFAGSRNWRVVYAVGLVAGALVWLVTSGAPAIVTQVTWWQLAAGRLHRWVRRASVQRLHVGARHLRIGIAAASVRCSRC
jgi:hypothetical protein